MSATALHPAERAARRAATRPMRARAWRRAALIAAPIVACIGLSANAGLRLFAAPAVATDSSFEQQDHFPGAADFYAAPDTASPAEGTTGTAELPPEPANLPAPVAFDATITAAQPFSMRTASTTDRVRALECLTAALYYEAASESDDGQRAVAQVVLNRVRHPAFPATVCGVVYQGSERASGCQFSFACDGAMARIPSRAGWARAARNAVIALAGQVYAPVGLATHYHTYAVTPAWNRTLVMTDAVGAHFFHRWKGYWGTAAAFHQHYAGGEPLPGPHAKLVSPLAATPIVAAAAIAPVAPLAMIQPAHVESGAAISDAASTNLPDSPILDRWKESGQPLR